jgi:predicted nucleic acid-binding protein
LGLTALGAFLKRHRQIALDSSIFIYYLEEYPLYADLADEVFSWLQRPSHSAVTSTITMTELLVHPYRAANELLVNQYYGLLSLFPNLEWVPPDLRIADIAAQLCAQHRLRTPDALQAATALRQGATGLLTNDLSFARIADIEIGLLDQLH